MRFFARFRNKNRVNGRISSPRERACHLAGYDYGPPSRMGGRVVEGTGLENRQAGDRLVGSNPTPSATTSASLFSFIGPSDGK